YLARTVEGLVPSPEPLHVELEPGGVIRGVVKAGPSGTRPHHLSAQVKRGQRRRAGAAVVAGGRFTLADLPPGDCRVFVRFNGWDYGDDGLATPLDVIAKSGETQTIQLTPRE